jgi:PTH1 family peptidyl-tRNA hydrolase
MKTIVGLGNPGVEYEGTRHNVGFEVLDALASACRVQSWRVQMQALVAKVRLCGVEIVLVKPQTYMNLSGDAVGALLRYFKWGVEDILVVHDELDFAPGEVRLKQGGGHGGHNGLRSIGAHVGFDFARVRVGVGKPARSSMGADYVLSRPSGAERVLLDKAVAESVLMIESVLANGVQAAMRQFHGNVGRH